MEKKYRFPAALWVDSDWQRTVQKKNTFYTKFITHIFVGEASKKSR